MQARGADFPAAQTPAGGILVRQRDFHEWSDSPMVEGIELRLRDPGEDQRREAPALWGSRKNKLAFWRERRAGICKAPRRRRCGDIVEDRQRRRCQPAAAPRRAMAPRPSGQLRSSDNVIVGHGSRSKMPNYSCASPWANKSLCPSGPIRGIREDPWQPSGYIRLDRPGAIQSKRWSPPENKAGFQSALTGLD